MQTSKSDTGLRDLIDGKVTTHLVLKKGRQTISESVFSDLPTIEEGLNYPIYFKQDNNEANLYKIDNVLYIHTVTGFPILEGFCYTVLERKKDSITSPCQASTAEQSTNLNITFDYKLHRGVGC